MKDIAGYLRRKNMEKKAIRQEFSTHGNVGSSIECDILLLVHSLEKGLAMNSPRVGFGMEKAEKAIRLLAQKSCNSFAYDEGMSILEKYIEYSVKSGAPISEIQRKFEQLKAEKPFRRMKAGTRIATKYRNNSQNAIEFLTSRHSIRAFTSERISDEMMEKVTELANTAPSACNRQPTKVYYTNAAEKVKKFDQLIPGNKGFEGKIPNWVILTTDRRMFTKGGYLQWYVNGGIYTAYFVEALHAYGIGSCIFQIPIVYEGVPELKNLMGISESEAVVAAIGFGYSDETSTVLESARRPVNEVLVKVE